MSSALRAGSDTGEPSSLAFSFSKLETEARAGFFLFSLFRVCVCMCMFACFPHWAWKWCLQSFNIIQTHNRGHLSSQGPKSPFTIKAWPLQLQNFIQYCSRYAVFA